MPKQYHILNDFSGGINLIRDARDIKDDELTDASNVQVYKSGQIYSSRVSTDVTSRGAGTLSNGLGIFLFKSDNDISDNVKSIELLGLADVATGTLDIIEDPFNTILSRDNTNHLALLLISLSALNRNKPYPSVVSPAVLSKSA